MSNAFEQGTRRLIPAVLIYPERANKILMIHRVSKVQDYHEGKWNGLGGKLELDESPIQAAIRELAEETGLSVTSKDLLPLGTLQFPKFKPSKQIPNTYEDWLVYVLSAKISDEKTAWQSGPEGNLEWIEKDKILELNLWPADKYFIPLVLEKKPFWGTIWYEGEKILKHWIHPID